MLVYCVASYLLEVRNLNKKYGHYFRILHCVMDQEMTAAMASMELTAAQGHIMGFIAHQKAPPCARDIEEAFHLSHPTVSGLLGRLEKKGFIALRPDPEDHRRKQIFILPKGQELEETMRATIDASNDRLVRNFTEEEKALFAAFLLRAIDNLGEPRKSKEESRS